jgi:hypothetical protein
MATEARPEMVAVAPALIASLVAAGRIKPVPSSLLSLVRTDLGGELPPDPLPPQIDMALDILAEPEARIRVLAREGEETTGYGVFFRRGEVVVQAALIPDGLVVAPPQSVRTFIDRFMREIGNNAPPDSTTSTIVVSPIALAGASWLWSFGQQNVTERAKSADLAAYLTQAGVKRPADLLKAVTDAGILRESGDVLTIEPAYRRWLTRVWTRSLFEIAVLPLRPDREPTPEDVREHQQQLVLVGAKGTRVACRAVRGSELASLGQGTLPENVQEEWHILLSHLTNEALRSCIESLLAIGAGTPPVPATSHV